MFKKITFKMDILYLCRILNHFLLIKLMILGATIAERLQARTAWLTLTDILLITQPTYLLKNYQVYQKPHLNITGKSLYMRYVFQK